jgi:hypothetical protein
VERFRETDLVEDFHGRGMDRVAAELPVKVFVHFEQRDRNALPRQQQSQHGSARTTTHNATGCVVYVEDLFTRMGRGRTAD